MDNEEKRMQTDLEKWKYIQNIKIPRMSTADKIFIIFVLILFFTFGNNYMVHYG